MIEIKVNDEIRDVTAEIALGLNLTQLITGVCGLTISTIMGGFLYYTFHLPIALLSYVIVILTAPFGFIMFFRYHEMTILTYLKYLFARLRDKNIKLYHCKNEEYIRMTSEANSKKSIFSKIAICNRREQK